MDYKEISCCLVFGDGAEYVKYFEYFRRLKLFGKNNAGELMTLCICQNLQKFVAQRENFNVYQLNKKTNIWENRGPHFVKSDRT